jgi:3-oxoacyl-(acyl-carrier-protein) synthase
MVLESAERAQERGARIYGSIKGLGTSHDTTCGPLDYSNVESTAIHAVSQSLEDIQDRTSPLRYIGNRHANDKHDEELSWLKGLWQGKCRMVNYSSQTGQSGFVGGLGMAAALLIKDEETDRYILVNTSSRGGIEAATLIERFEHA